MLAVVAPPRRRRGCGRSSRSAERRPHQQQLPRPRRATRPSPSSRVPAVVGTAALMLLLVAALVAILPSTHAADITLFCKCECAPNVTIITVPRCAECTKALCVSARACYLPPSPSPEPSLSSSSLSSTTDASAAAANGSFNALDAFLGEWMARRDAAVETDGADTDLGSDSDSLTPTSTVSSSLSSSFAVSTVSQPAETLTTAPKKPVAPDDDWIVTCFQRGSYKDELTVYAFLVIVVALLLWAAARPHLEGPLGRWLRSRAPFLFSSSGRRRRERRPARGLVDGDEDDGGAHMVSMAETAGGGDAVGASSGGPWSSSWCGSSSSSSGSGSSSSSTGTGSSSSSGTSSSS
ncbi:hypothetical protein HK405_001769, partial [Cladochytrium tenue]